MALFDDSNSLPVGPPDSGLADRHRERVAGGAAACVQLRRHQQVRADEAQVEHDRRSGRPGGETAPEDFAALPDGDDVQAARQQAHHHVRGDRQGGQTAREGGRDTDHEGAGAGTGEGRHRRGRRCGQHDVGAAACARPEAGRRDGHHPRHLDVVDHLDGAAHREPGERNLDQLKFFSFLIRLKQTQNPSFCK